MEIWAAINERYEVSDAGRVRSVDTESFDGRGRRRFRKGKELKPSMRPDGYLVVNISGFKHRRQWKVHHLVAIHFHGDFFDTMVVNHKNGIRHDNRAENLEWCTSSHNNLHAFRELGRTAVSNSGAKNGYSRRIIDRESGQIFDSITTAAKSLGIGRSTLNAMLSGQNPNKTSMEYL